MPLKRIWLVSKLYKAYNKIEGIHGGIIVQGTKQPNRTAIQDSKTYRQSKTSIQKHMCKARTPTSYKTETQRASFSPTQDAYTHHRDLTKLIIPCRIFFTVKIKLPPLFPTASRN